MDSEIINKFFHGINHDDDDDWIEHSKYINPNIDKFAEINKLGKVRPQTPNP